MHTYVCVRARHKQTRAVPRSEVLFECLGILGHARARTQTHIHTICLIAAGCQSFRTHEQLAERCAAAAAAAECSINLQYSRASASATAVSPVRWNTYKQIHKQTCIHTTVKPVRGDRSLGQYNFPLNIVSENCLHMHNNTYRFRYV